MRILVFSWRDPKHPLAGGAEQVMHEHMKGWVEAGNKVTLLASSFENSTSTEELDGIKIIRSGYQYLGVQVAGFLYYLQHSHKYDLIVDQFHGIPFFTPLFVRKPKIAVIQETAREVWFLNPLPFPINFIIGLVGYLIEPVIFLFYRSTIFMTGSKSAKQDIKKMGIPEKNINIIPHGVIIRLPHPMPDKEQIPTIIFLGMLSKDKGIEDAIRCFSLLKKVGQYQFWVVGRAETTEYKNQIIKLVKDLNIQKDVTFFGFISQEKKFELLARAHVLINPSVKEGWGLVNIEANSLGVPVVAYLSRGLIDSVNDGVSGILCSQNTPSELAENINRLFNDQVLYKLLSRGAVAWSNNFSWKKSTAMSLELIYRIGKQKHLTHPN